MIDNVDIDILKELNRWVVREWKMITLYNLECNTYEQFTALTIYTLPEDYRQYKDLIEKMFDLLHKERK